MKSKTYYDIRHFGALIVKFIPNLCRFFRWKTWREESYYPEKERKSTLRIFFEQLWYIFHTGKINLYYFAYGLDVKNWHNVKDYMDDEDFLWKCSLYNRLLVDLDYTCILRDKALFQATLTSWGYNTPRVLFNSNVDTIEDIIANLTANRGGIFVSHSTDNAVVEYSNLLLKRIIV